MQQQTRRISGCGSMVTFVYLYSTQYKFMHVRYWQIIRDDSRRTFEVCGQISNENSFTNKTYAMQKAGMNVSCMVPPVTSKTSSKGLIKIAGYQPEAGLYERLLKQYAEITKPADHDDPYELL